MSQLLSKLESQDNVEFGREMSRTKREENIPNLIEWLNSEATLRSRGKTSFPSADADRQRQPPRKVQAHTVNSETTDEVSSSNDSDRHRQPPRKVQAHSENETADDICPLGCESKHFLHACPQYLESTVNDRWETVKKHKRCRKCLKKHHTSNCNQGEKVSCNKCNKEHHSSLHNDRPPRLNSTLNPGATPFNGKRQVDNNSAQGNAKIQGICPVQKVKIKDKDGNYVEALAMIDSGSNVSLISNKLKNQLGINCQKTHLTMNLAGGKKKSEDSEIVNITVVSTLDENIKKCISVCTVNKPCSPAKTVSKNTVNNYVHLREISNKLHLAGGTVDLLIGTDFADAFIDIHIIQGNEGEPIAKRNCFGWYVLGQFTSQENQLPEIKSVDVGTVSVTDDINTLLTQDLLGVKPTSLCSCKDETLKENKFIKAISKSTEMIDGRIQVRMPWKDSGPPKESNYQMAHDRMISFERTLQRKNCSEVIQEEINKLLEQEFVIEIPPEKVNHETPEWYLPLHAVFTPERTTQVRLVFDASAKGPNNQSLNDHLEKGPNYINSLPDVLLAWRWDNIAYTGDIRKMFNQVKIHPDDQVFHRFLWRANPTEPPKVYQWTRLNFGDKPAPDIATGAINFLAKCADVQYPEASKELLTHMYVDDLGGSKGSEAEAKQITSDIDTILQKGKFEIKAWHSNSKSIDQTDEENTTFLGHKWNKSQDIFRFNKREIIADLRNLTKRNCLACLAQIWDPIGLVVPVTIELRIDLQELWCAGYTWDEILPEEIQTKWMKNIEGLNQLLSHEFKRKLKPDNVVGLPEIHGFSDAGEKAYGSVIFLRWELTDGSYSCIPVMVKAFVAPLKKKSIPRLELMGCLSLTRLYATCNEALTFAEISDCKKVLWIDSQTVLAWVKTSPRKFKPFVSARVAEIQETIDTQVFKYIQSQYNPADALTRGIPENQLENWMNGPSFLKQPEKDWPTFEEPSPKENDVDAEKEMKNCKQHSIECSVNSTEKIENPIMEHLMKSCSSFRKARRALAYVLRFIHNAKGKVKKSGPISVEELKDSEVNLFKWCQTDLELETLDKKLMAKRDDQGVIRAHGRLENIRALSEDLRRPIVLPRKHALVTFLLKQLHETRGHCGYKSLMHESRRRFWIIGLRNTAKLLTRSCITCRKLRQKPLTQQMGQLPTLRVAAGSPVFTHTAIDMFGPIQIRLNRRTLKEAQVAIFTCMTSRAVHLELCTDGSSDAFLMAFRRFASLRGHPHICWSDCGSNFKGAQGYMSEVTKNWNIQEIEEQLTENFSCQFEWRWNIPQASHMNGVVESLIKSVRQAINATCKNQAYTEEQWRTFLTEVSYIVNSRPLYPSANEIWESPPVQLMTFFLDNTTSCLSQSLKIKSIHATFYERHRKELEISGVVG